MFAKVNMINHGLDQAEVGKIYCYHEGLFQPLPIGLSQVKCYGDWTVIESITDADNFNCFTGEDYILNLATNLKVNKMLNRYSGKEMSEQEAKDCAAFTWNSSCTQDQIERMGALRKAGEDLCQLLIANVPNSADRSAGIRSLRLAIMQCNLAIAHEGYKP